jgi:hypothetical protein
MASIQREVSIQAGVQEIWEALRDWGALHERLAPGFVTDTRLDGADRIVTFFNGTVVRERLITLDDDTHRLVWSIIDGPYTHHNGVAQLLAEGAHRTRFVWTADLLPDEFAERTALLMELGLSSIKDALEGAHLAPAA